MADYSEIYQDSERHKRLKVKKPYSLIKFNFGVDPYPTSTPDFSFWNQLTLQQARFGLHGLDKIIKRNRFPRDKTEYWKEDSQSRKIRGNKTRYWINEQEKDHNWPYYDNRKPWLNKTPRNHFYSVKTFYKFNEKKEKAARLPAPKAKYPIINDYREKHLSIWTGKTQNQILEDLKKPNPTFKKIFFQSRQPGQRIIKSVHFERENEDFIIYTPTEWPDYNPNNWTREPFLWTCYPIKEKKDITSYNKPSEWWGIKLGDYSPRTAAAVIKQFKKDLDHELFNYEENRKSLIYPPIFPAKKDIKTARLFKIFFEGKRDNGKLRTTGLNLHGTIKELIPYGLKYNCVYDPHQERIISYNDKLPYPDGIKSYSPSQEGNQRHKNSMLRFAYTKTHYKKNQKIMRKVRPPEIIIKCPNCKREKPEHELKRYDSKKHESYCLFCGYVMEDMEKWSLTPKTSDDYREGNEGQLQATYGNKKYSPEKLSETLYAPMGKPNKTNKGNPHYFRAARREKQGKLKTNKKAYYSSIDTTTPEGKQEKLKGRKNTKYQEYKEDLEILTDYYNYYRGTSYEIQGNHIQKVNERFINLNCKIQDFQGVRPHIKPPRGVNKNIRKNVLLTLLIYELQLHGYNWSGVCSGGKLPDFRKKGPGKLIGFNKKVYGLLLDKLGLEGFGE